jgi:hypothetical protein
MSKPSFSKLLEEVGLFCAQYNKVSAPLLTSTGKAKNIAIKLNEIRQYFLDHIPSANSMDIRSTISWGSGYFPRVPWVGFHVKGSSVTNSLSVVICFSRDGAGVVCGLMAPAGRKSRYKTIKRTKFTSYLNVTGTNKTNYNDQFINPKDFHFYSIKEVDLFNHLEESLNFLISQKTDDFLEGSH